MKQAPLSKKKRTAVLKDYDAVLVSMVELLDTARRTSARTINSIMTATYWEMGRRLVEFEQQGKKRAEYGEALLIQLGNDLTERFGRGFSRSNLQRFRQFYLSHPTEKIRSILSSKLSNLPSSAPSNIPGQIRSTLSSVFQGTSGNVFPFTLDELSSVFPLPWSHYVLLISRCRSPEACSFYHTEALRGGWSVRQLLRQIDTQFYERTALSKNKIRMLQKGGLAQPEDNVTAEEEIKDPLVLEFLDLKDEYSESDLEEALMRQLEHFLLELGNDFAFIARQKRLRIGDEWYRIDLLFFHRVLRCLVVIDLKLGRLTHADTGQMHVYLNYAREHLAQPKENPPVGIILCAEKNRALVHYATDNLPNKVLIREYLTTLPNEEALANEINIMREKLEKH